MGDHGCWSCKHLHIYSNALQLREENLLLGRAMQEMLALALLCGHHAKEKALKPSPFPGSLLHGHLLKQSGSCLLLHGSSSTVFPDRSADPLSTEIMEQFRLEL